MTSIMDSLKESYLAFLRDRIQFKDLNGTIEITTPIVDRHNDYFQIYATPLGGDRIRLTDAGYVLADLELDGVDVFTTPKRKEIFQTVLNRYGVACSKSKELYVETTIASFPQKKHMLIQAMLTVNDMFMTSRSNTSGIFIDEIAKFLEENDIRSIPNVAFIGKSGFTHQFDFVIPKSKQEPERVIKTLNTVTKQSASLIIFAWNDTKEMRGPDPVLFVFINDTVRKVNADTVKAFRQYDMQPVLWSHRQDYLPRLTA
jgi:hypothetical protein